MDAGGLYWKLTRKKMIGDITLITAFLLVITATMTKVTLQIVTIIR